MQEILSSNSPVVTGTCDQNKSQARQYRTVSSISLIKHWRKYWSLDVILFFQFFTQLRNYVIKNGITTIIFIILRSYNKNRNNMLDSSFWKGTCLWIGAQLAINKKKKTFLVNRFPTCWKFDSFFQFLQKN